MSDQTAPGVPLGQFREHPGVGVRFHCRTCMQHFDLPLEDVIAGLEARGDGGAATGIKAVAALMRRPCVRCGGVRFETSPAWPGRERTP